MSLPAIAPVVWYKGKEWIVAPDVCGDRLGGNVVFRGCVVLRGSDGEYEPIKFPTIADLLASLDRAPSQAVWDVLRVVVGR